MSATSAAQLLQAGVNQMNDDLKAVVETMTPAERAAALVCASHGLTTVANAMTLTGNPAATTVSMAALMMTALSDSVGAEQELDHSACHAMLAIPDRMPRLLAQVREEVAR